jgi:hypothetical protein
VGSLVSGKQYNEAADMFLSSFQTWPALGAGLIFLTSVILLAWPARRAREGHVPDSYFVPHHPHHPNHPDHPSPEAAHVKGA